MLNLSYGNLLFTCVGEMPNNSPKNHDFMVELLLGSSHPTGHHVFQFPLHLDETTKRDLSCSVEITCAALAHNW